MFNDSHANSGFQTENQWFSSDVEVHTELEEIQPVTDTVSIQTELDDVMQVHRADDTVKHRVGIVDAKYNSLIMDATG